MKTVVKDIGVFSIEEFLDSVVERAPKNWAAMTKDGKKQLLGCFDMLTSDGKNIIVFPVWENEQQKQMAVATVRGLAREHDCVACVIFQEAWIVDAHRRIPGLALWQHPEHLRREILFVVTMSGTGSPPMRCIHWSIIRTGIRARLGAAQEMTSFSTETFHDLLPKREIKTT